MLSYVQAHYVAWLAVILAILPSLIVGLTPYPKVDGVLKFLSQLLNLFSLTVHSDSPGTLKPPLVQSQPPAVVGSTLASPAAAALKALVFLFALSHLTACAALSGTMVENDLVNCGESAIQSAITPAVLSSVSGALMGTTSDVEPTLENIGLTAGADAVFCAIGQIVTQLEAAGTATAVPAAYSVRDIVDLERAGDHVWAVPAFSSSSPDRVQIAIIRGEQILHGWKLSGTKLVHRRTK